MSSIQNHTELREALFDGHYRRTTVEARKRLRRIAGNMFNAKKSGFEDAISRSPIIGDGANQHNIASVPQLYQAIHNDVLAALIADVINLADIRLAVKRPDDYGFANSTSKSGYQLGRPVGLSQADIDNMMDKLAQDDEQGNSVGFEPIEVDGLGDACDVITTAKALGVPITITEQIMVENGVDKIMAASAAAAVRSNGGGFNALPDEDPRVARIVAIAADDDEDDTVAEEEPKPVVGLVELPKPEQKIGQMIDFALDQAKLPPIGELIDRITDQAVNIASMTDTIEKLKRSASSSVMPTSVAANGAIPKGTAKAKKAYEVFGLPKRKILDFNVPVWEWEHDHPHVPRIDESYVFRPKELVGILQAILTNQRCYLHGHSGTGKTTGVEQVCARLFWPVMRINFDSEITRMDIIGRDTLIQEGGTTVSKFVDGILPSAMSGPYVLICDEIDFVRPDVAYVMQRAFEGNGLVVTEDGGRVVVPHEAFRMFATGNTVGQGDEYGMYQGARPQSMAMLDRFTMWIKVEYMDAADRAKLIKSKFPALEERVVESINKYVTEHIEAFTTSKVLQPITPRGFLSLAQNYSSAEPLYARQADAMEFAFATTVLDRCTVQDRAVLNDIYQRVFG